MSTTVKGAHIYAYVYPCIKANHRRVGSYPRCDKSQRTHMLNNFSTSSGVTSLCTKISGGLVLSINDLRKPRFVDGPGIKYVLLATPYQQHEGLISPPLLAGELLRRQGYKRTTSSSSAAAFPLRVLSAATPGVSLDEMARLASSPMGTASSGYGSISDSTRVFGERGASPEPDDAGRAWACFCDACSSSDSSDWPPPLSTRVSSWNGFAAVPARTGADRTEDWSRSSHAITF